MKVLLTIFFALIVSTTVSAQSFEERPIDKFKMLNEFKSVEAFQNYIDKYVQNCLDHSYGGSLSVRCFVGYELWDRELNKYYQLLRNKLTSQQKKLLQDAQRSWIKTRDATIKMNSSFLDDRYNNKRGTMYIAIRAGDAANAITPIIKQRTLLLRNWYQDLKEE